MGTHKRCPACKDRILADSTSCRCGWQANGEAPERAEGMCAFNEHGYACRLVGLFSFGTTGSGPWYCREHFNRVQGRAPEVTGNEIPKRSQSLAVREWHAKMAAHRAMQDRATSAADEGQEKARQATEREPGEDVEEEAAAWER